MGNEQMKKYGGCPYISYKNGLFVIKQSGEVVKIAKDKKFKPQLW